MKPIPATAKMLGVVPRIIWFEPPERALADPVRFMAYAMTYARHEDMRVIREYVSDEDFREALDRAPAGIIDPRSWAYWNSKMGRPPIGKVAMSGSERVQRYRLKHVTKPVTKPNAAEARILGHVDGTDAG